MAWNDDHYLSQLRECILQHQLVPFHIDLSVGMDWSQHCQACLQYLEEYVASKHKTLIPRSVLP